MMTLGCVSNQAKLMIFLENQDSSSNGQNVPSRDQFQL